MLKIHFDTHVLTVEPTIRISELTEMVRKKLGFHSGHTRLEIEGTGLAAAARLSDYLRDPAITDLFISVYNAPSHCCHGSPYDPESGTYLCGKC